MKKMQITARTVEDAITEASLKLGVTSDKLEYEVLEEGSAGFFGIGKKEAAIAAWLKGSEKEDKAPAKEKKEAKKDAKKDSKKEPKKDNKKKKPAKKKQPAEPAFTPEEKAAPVKKEKDLTPVNEETQKVCEDYLMQILTAMGLQAKVSSRQEEDKSLYMEVEGENMGLIIGKRGQTLDAIQYLLNRVANQRQEGSLRIRLDTEDYRERRKQTLENLARNIASKAKKTHKNVVLEPMNPYERMIIHSALQKDPAVTTYSKGKEPYRTVVVAVKKGE